MRNKISKDDTDETSVANETEKDVKKDAESAAAHGTEGPANPIAKLVTPGPELMVGGASGIPDRVANAVTVVTVAPVTDGPKLPNYAGPKPRRYKVVVGGTVMMNNCRTTLRAGKDIDERHYDVESIMRQGIELRRVEAPGEEVLPTDDPATARAKTPDAVIPKLPL